MAEPLATAFVRIRPNVDDFEKDAKRDLSRAGRGLTREGGRQGKLFGTSFVKGSAGPFRGMVGIVGGPLTGALAALGSIKVFKGFIDDARESNRIARITAQAIRSTGGAAKVSAKQVGDLATAISNKTGADDEAIQSGANLLLRFSGIRNELGKGNKIFDRATTSVVDMAAAMNKGVVSEQGIASASKALGKALADPEKGLLGLRKAGVLFTDQQVEQIKTLVESGKTLEAQKIILDEVAKKTGGAAKAGADPMQRLQTIIGNAGETIGNALLPYVDKAATFLGKHLPGAVETASRWFKTELVPAVKGVLPVFQAIVGGVGSLVGWFARLPRPIQVVVAALGTVFALRGKISGLVGSIRGIGDALGNLGTKAGGGAKGGGVGGLLSRVGRFAGIFGPAGVAVGVLAGIVSSFGGDSEEAAGRVDELTDALKRDSGAIRDNTKAVLAKHLADSGLISDARNAGVSFDTVTSAALGQKGAMTLLGDEQKRVELRLRQLSQPQLQLNEAQEAERRVLVKRRAALAAVNEKLGETSSELSKARQNAIDHTAATKAVRRATDDMSATTRKAVRSLAEHAGKLGLNRDQMKKLIGRFGEGRAEFVRQAKRMGVNSDAAKRLYDKLRKIPGKYRADVTANTKPASTAITRFIRGFKNKAIRLAVSAAVGGPFSALFRNRGGPIPGWMGQRGRDSVPTLLTPDEHVVSEPEVRGAGGHAAVERQRKIWLRGARRLNTGGAVNLRVNADTSPLRNTLNAIGKKVSEFFAGGGNLLGWAKRHDGRPYVWGGSGPFGFDCSGWVSALVNRARGRSNPYSRLGSTATFPWSGFAPGPGRILSVGSTRNAGGGIGHMAASIGRIPSESAGGRGVLTGSGSRGAFDGLFGGNVWHPQGLRRGGRVDLRRGDPPFDLLDPRGRLYQAVNGYRRGTPWVPEDQMAWLHKGEGIVPRDVNEARLRAAGPVRLHPDDIHALARALRVEVKMDGRKVAEIVGGRTGARGNLYERGG